jgi:hypothetical protein
MRIRIKLANELVPIFAGFLLEHGDEGLDQFSARSAEGLRSTEVCGITLNQVRIKVVLPDQKTKLVTEPRLTIVEAILGL